MSYNRSEAIGPAVNPEHEAVAVNQDVSREAELGRLTESESAIHVCTSIPQLGPVHILFRNKLLPDFGVG